MRRSGVNGDNDVNDTAAKSAGAVCVLTSPCGGVLNGSATNTPAGITSDGPVALACGRLKSGTLITQPRRPLMRATWTLGDTYSETAPPACRFVNTFRRRRNDDAVKTYCLLTHFRQSNRSLSLTHRVTHPHTRDNVFA